MSYIFFKRFQRVKAMIPALNRAMSLRNAIYSLTAKNKIDFRGIYLDAGCGLGVNTLVFSEYFSEIFGLELKKKSVLRSKLIFSRVRLPAHFIIGDARRLPFKPQAFDVVSAFSLIEHLVSKEEFVSEVARILKKQGVLVMQFPNANFPIDLHTGLFFPQIIPSKLKDLYAKRILGWDLFPYWNLTGKKAIEIFKVYFRNVYLDKMNYSDDVIPTKFFRVLYRLLERLRLLKICPLGYIVICTNPLGDAWLLSSH